MHPARKFSYFGLIAAAFILSPPTHAQDLKTVLQRLDTAARGFTNVTANFEFDTIQTNPVPDTDIMTGVIYYQRSGGHFQMAAHAKERGDDRVKHPSANTYIFSGGTLRQSDTGKASDAHTIDRASKYESYFMLGFGASGKDLEDKWDITYIGTEKVDGVTTDKLELVAKDPGVRRNLPKVTLWMDTAHAVSLKQVFDEGEGNSRVSHYTNIKFAQASLPSNAFSFDK
jgi:hypothetical protein